MHRARAAWCATPRSLVRCQTTAALQNVRPYREVPGPKPLPLLGNAWRYLPIIGTFNSDIVLWIADMHATYGDIVKISNLPGRRDLVLLFNPDHFEAVLRNEGQWPKRYVIESIAHYRDKIRPDFFQHVPDLGNSNGERWQAARTVGNAAMMQPRVAAQYVARVDQVAREFLHRISGLRDENQEMPDEFRNELKKWTLEAMTLITLDTRLGCLAENLASDSEPQKVVDAVQEILNGSFELDRKIPIWKLFQTPKMKKFIKHSDIFLDFAIKHVEAARAAMSESTPEGEMSVLQRILRGDQNFKRAVVMAIDALMAGVHSTSFTAAVVLYYLASDPQRQERLFQELRSLMPENPEAPLTADIMENMKYLRACIKEAMRLAPVGVANSRILDKEIVLDNYVIPADVEFILVHSLACRKSFASPNDFVPERWLRGKGACPDESLHHFAHLPFGYGPRKCIGMRFANLQLETLVARVLQRFRLEWHYGEMVYKCKYVNAMDLPLRFKVIDRDDRH